MTSGRKYTLGQIARKLSGTVRGDPQLTITGPAAIDQGQAGTITFLEDIRLAKQLQSTRASAVLVQPGTELPQQLSAVEVDQPGLAFARVLQMFAPALPGPERGIDQTAVLQGQCSIADDAAIGPHCFLGSSARIGSRTVIHHNVHIAAETTIGQDCIIYPGVVIRERTVIGDRVIIHPNAVIGADGFGYNFVDGRHEKVPQIGLVIIENDVEIGACTCIDRAKVGFTKIGAGTKIDNLVQIGHNVIIGSHCIVVGQTGMAGSSRLQDYVILGSRTAVTDHVEIGDRSVVGALSGVTKDLPPDSLVSGFPAIPNRQYWRQQANLKQLAQLGPELKRLIKRVEELESTTHNRQNS